MICVRSQIVLKSLRTTVLGTFIPCNTDVVESPLKHICKVHIPRFNPLLSLTLVPPGSPSLRAYPLISVITRQPSAVSHFIPTASASRVLSPHPPPGSTCSETQASETHGSSESETEQPTPRLKKPRRSRTIFTELQLMGLEKKFQKQKYLSTPDR